MSWLIKLYAEQTTPDEVVIFLLLGTFTILVVTFVGYSLVLLTLARWRMNESYSMRQLLFPLAARIRKLNCGVIRLAVGQLLDYRRNVPRPAATDLAVLLPMRPDDAMAEFLSSLGIKLVWIEFDLNQLVGDWELRPGSQTA